MIRGSPRTRRLRLLLPLALAPWLACGRTPGGASPSPAAATPAPAVKAWLAPWSGSGVDFVVRTGHRDDRFLMPESIGGGAALFDMDGDGDLDLYLVQSWSPAGDPTLTNRLYRNDGQGRFTDVTAHSGAGLSAGSGPEARWGMGVASGDYDNDGDPDLYVTNLGPNVLLRNDGQGRFTDVTREARVGDEAWGSSAAFCDLDRDGDLDLFVLNYLNWRPASEIRCLNAMGSPDFCTPRNYQAPARAVLYRNNGDGTFDDVTEAAGLGVRFGHGLGIVCGDFDADGWLDVYVANDAIPNQLWLNRRDLRFEDDALLRGCAVDQDGRAKAGMGVAAVDVDDDGDLDILVGNLRKETDSFYSNEGGVFRDVTSGSGLAAESSQFTRFGLGMHDLDNDGLLDLFQANGRVAREALTFGPDPYAEPKLLFRGIGPGRFERLPEAALGGAPAGNARGVAFGDLDDDGGIDVVVVNQEAPVEVLRNQVPGRGNWLLIRVLEEHGRDALNATVSGRLGSRRLSRDVQSAYSYVSASDPRVHFGLGSATRLEEVSVRWIDGSVERFGDLEANRIAVLRRGSGTPGREGPAAP